MSAKAANAQQPFITRERQAATHFLRTSDWIPDHLRAGGHYQRDRGRLLGPYPFCLPITDAAENLFGGFREEALSYFIERGIAWHDATDAGPSNHLLDSQVCCVNFLFPLRRRPEVLQRLLETTFGPIDEVLEIPGEDGFLAFEWVGDQDYLGEWTPGAEPTRGAMVTSADAAVRFLKRGKVHQVLIEWKYTESYADEETLVAEGRPLTWEGRKGVIRRQRYEHLLNRDEAFLSDAADLGHFSCEPAYQLMRQQLLAQEMERLGVEAELVSVLHLSAARNTKLHRVTPIALRQPEGGPGDIFHAWSGLVQTRGDGSARFLASTLDKCFSDLLRRPPQGLDDWARYIGERYTGVLGDSEAGAGH